MTIEFCKRYFDTDWDKGGGNTINTPPEADETEAHILAKRWCFETNGHKWSNNDDTLPDNYGSFIAGYEAGSTRIA